jgi:hypothetical protein
VKNLLSCRTSAMLYGLASSSNSKQVSRSSCWHAVQGCVASDK